MVISKFEKLRLKLYLGLSISHTFQPVVLKIRDSEPIAMVTAKWNFRKIRLLDRRKMHFQPQNQFSNRSRIIEELWCHRKSTEKCSTVLSSPDLCRQFGRSYRKVWFKETKKATFYAKNFALDWSNTYMQTQNSNLNNGR